MYYSGSYFLYSIVYVTSPRMLHETLRLLHLMFEVLNGHFISGFCRLPDSCDRVAQLSLKNTDFYF